VTAPGSESVVRVDADDRALGSFEKLAAHRHPGVLHRAFSVLLFDGRHRLLLQRRAAAKYHFRNRWSNSVCSHPRPGEDLVQAGQRRVREELGLTVELVHLASFEYRAIDLDSGLVEHELDHVLVGTTDGAPRLDPDEVAEVRWVDAYELAGWLAREPEVFTPWFVPALQAAAGTDDVRGAFGRAADHAPAAEAPPPWGR
jgi:isopentenyl-diphosphate Delta-isomerase